MGQGLIPIARVAQKCSLTIRHQSQPNRAANHRPEEAAVAALFLASNDSPAQFCVPRVRCPITFLWRRLLAPDSAPRRTGRSTTSAMWIDNRCSSRRSL